MSDFLREVDEDYQRDQLIKLFKRIGPWLIAGAVLIIAVFAGGVFWRAHLLEQQAQQTAMLDQAREALANGDKDAALAQLTELQVEGSAGIAALARLAQARVMVDEGRVSEAAALFEAVSVDADLPQQLRDYGALMSVIVQLDSMSADDVSARLAPLAIPGATWYASASEAIAIAYLRDGRQEEARAQLDLLVSDPGVPGFLRQRASIYLQLIGPALGAAAPTDEPVEDVEPTSSPEGSPPPAPQQDPTP